MSKGDEKMRKEKIIEIYKTVYKEFSKAYSIAKTKCYKYNCNYYITLQNQVYIVSSYKLDNNSFKIIP